MRAALAFAALVAAMTALAPAASASSDGRTRFMFNARSTVAHWLTGASTSQRDWMNATYWRERGYPPYHTNVGGLEGAPPTDFYQDLYAIYNDDRRNGEPDRGMLTEHPSWVLRDAEGNPMYIPWACDGGTCPQYAADVGNPDWRRDWIDRALEQMQDGYAGVHIDDVNLEMMVGSGSGEVTAPIDPRTGRPMTQSNWKRYVAEFVEQIQTELKAAYPNAVVSINVGQWWLSHDDPYYQRIVRASDVVELERGLNDQGLVAGGGTFGFNTYLAHIDWLHSLGSDVTYEPYNLDLQSATFQLAGYLVMQEGDDSITAEFRCEPDDWWKAWETDLGPAEGARYTWNGLIRRDFQNGTALINPIGGRRTTADVSGIDLDGKRVDSITLGAREGAVLRAVPGDPPVVPQDPPTVDPPTTGQRGKVKLKSARVRGHRMVIRGAAAPRAPVTLQRKHHGWRPAARRKAGVHGGFKISVRIRSKRFSKVRVAAPRMKSSRSVRVRH